MRDPSLTAVCQLFAPRERFVEEEKQIIQQRRKIATALGRQKGKIEEPAGKAGPKIWPKTAQQPPAAGCAVVAAAATIPRGTDPMAH
jgi:hypothetical protein